MLRITAPNGVVFPYLNSAKEYLLHGGDVKTFYKNQFEEINQAIPIVIGWQTDESPLSFTVKYSTDTMLEGCNTLTVKGSERQIGVYNLLKDATYFVEVVANYSGCKTEKARSTFKTTDLGPRPIKIDGIYNTRDIGGYKCQNGFTTAQGKIFRGGLLSACKDYESVGLTLSGKTHMSKTLGIKTEIDLRTPQEAECGSVSAIPDARLIYTSIEGYDALPDYSDGVKALFSILADGNNYPVYIHCTGGADRTGTICYLINALLGVDEKTLIQDYEFTSFSYFGVRSVTDGWTKPLFEKFKRLINGNFGDTLSEKTENLL